MKNSPAERTRRKIYLVLVFLIPILGLGIRARPQFFPAFFTNYAPDILWAFLVFSLVCLILPRLPTIKAALAATLFSIAIECSQLFQAAWIVDLRATRIGGLLLGFGFLWSDLICYAAGILLGAMCDCAIRSILLRQNKEDEKI